MSRSIAPALLIGLLTTAPPVLAQEHAAPSRIDRLAAATLLFTPAADATVRPTPGHPLAIAPPTPARGPGAGTLALGALGGAAAGVAIGCAIGDCRVDFLQPPDDALVGGLLGAVFGLVIALWIEPDDDWPSPRLPPR